MSSQTHEQVPTSEQVLVVGAGPAGLAAAAALKALEVPFTMVDSAANVGGIWDPQREDTPVWPSLEMISSRQFTQYEDLLQPVSFPEHLTPAHMAKYLRAYAAKYQLTDHFRPHTTVRRAEPFGAGRWQVELSTGEIGIWRAIVAAHGISQRPYLPAWAHDLPEHITVMHAREWPGASEAELEGKRVLVVGSGQSAADIAVDAARRAQEVRWSARTGHWVVPRKIGPVAGDVAAAKRPAALGGLNDRIAARVITAVAGDPSAYGLPAPSVPVTEDRVIVSDDVLERISEGRITPMSDVAGIEGSVQERAGGTGIEDPAAPRTAIRFENGGLYEADIIVLATGYRPGAEYLPEDVVPATTAGTPDLFLGTFPRTRDDLVLLGQVHVNGGILPLLVQQADVAAYFLRAVMDDAPAAEAFRRVRAGSDAAVTPLAGNRTGRLAQRLGAKAPKTAPLTPTQQAARTVGGFPVADRDQLVAKLRALRPLFA